MSFLNSKRKSLTITNMEKDPELTITLTVSQLGIALLGAITIVTEAKSSQARKDAVTAMNLFNSYMPKLHIPADDELSVGGMTTLMDKEYILTVLLKDHTGYFVWRYEDSIKDENHFENSTPIFECETYNQLLKWWNNGVAE